MNPVIRQRWSFHWNRGLSPKTQKFLPFGSGRLTPPSRAHEVLGESALERTRPMSFGPAGGAPLAGIAIAHDAATQKHASATRERRTSTRRSTSRSLWSRGYSPSIGVRDTDGLEVQCAVPGRERAGRRSGSLPNRCKCCQRVGRTTPLRCPYQPRSVILSDGPAQRGAAPRPTCRSRAQPRQGSRARHRSRAGRSRPIRRSWRPSQP